jgi:hypothetical protein
MSQMMMNQQQQRDLLLESILSGINNGVFVEIGTYRGDFVDKVLSLNRTAKIFCIDPYTSYDEYNDSLNKMIGDTIYDETYNNLKSKYGDRIQFIRLTSADAVGMIPDNIDFLHIDGNHEYSFVKRDLELYFPKVKSNGFVLGSGACDEDESKRDAKGNVFIEHSPENYRNYGVVKAFSEFITAKNLTGAGSNSRIFFKKTTHPTVAPCPNNDLCFVSRFGTAGLPSNGYIQHLLNIMSFQYKLILFVDQNTMNELSKYKLNNNVTLIDINDVKDTFSLKYMKLEREIMSSTVYEKAISNCRAKFTPEHTLGGHSKINYIRHAKSVNSDYMVYAWIDHEYINSQTNAGKIPTDKFTFYSLKDMPVEKLEPDRVLASDDVYINCSSFIVPNSYVEAFELLYEYKLIEWQTRWIADDDQSLVLQMVQDYPDLFYLVKYPVHQYNSI